jgi:hypothetical protein
MEHHRFVGAPTGQPMTADREGACVRIPLDSPPSPRWSHIFSSHLAGELVGMPGVARLSLDHAVQGAEVVLEGIQIEEGQRFGPALQASVEAANRACDRPAPGDDSSRNMDQATADGVARAVATDLG